MPPQLLQPAFESRQTGLNFLVSIHVAHKHADTARGLLRPDSVRDGRRPNNKAQKLTPSHFVSEGKAKVCPALCIAFDRFAPNVRLGQ
jgi:hypothetical protein